MKTNLAHNQRDDKLIILCRMKYHLEVNVQEIRNLKRIIDSKKTSPERYLDESLKEKNTYW